MHAPAWIVLRRVAFGLLAVLAFLVLAQPELEPGTVRSTLRALEVHAAALLLLLFLPTLAARLQHIGSGAGLPMTDRVFASLIEAALYGLMLIQPLLTWLVASLDQTGATILGSALPPLAPGDPAMGQEIGLAHDVGAAMVLLLLALHIRNRGLAMLAAATRSLSYRGRSLPASSEHHRAQRRKAHPAHQPSHPPHREPKAPEP
jgi:cytochrome b561